MKTFLNPLTPEEERYYLERFRDGDQEAKRILIVRNMRLVAHLVKKYYNGDREMEDLISVGTIGLIKAVNTFDIEKNNRLAAYASKCVENELLMLFRSEKKRGKETSIYEPLGTDSEGNSIRLLDVIECEEEDALERIDRKEKTEKLYELVNTILNEREKEIICLRYGLYRNGEVTQRQIADQLGISRSYVSRIEKKALKKLKKEFDNRNIHFHG
ncbi:MAG: RNA polymerase sporulation sigma factor SigK [Lachnospiraceae bacterium]|nr:RNA polymerase sporulation sigma factor SigK [Lachnospiraceae bacterium]